jgi:hypothetical protein
MTEKEEANRLYRLMYVIIREKQDAKDCAIIMAKELENAVDRLRDEKYYQEVINEIKKI